jgi:ABC-2 type transport system ATP-binding protein
MTKTAIRLENLTRDFGQARALNDLSLEVPSGIVYGFLGPNGAGKTTTLRLMLGLLEPTAGQAEVLGFDARTQADEIRTHTGALLEHTGVYEQLSAEDNLEFFARIYRIPAAERKSRIKELLTHINLWDRRKEPAGKWSRGMKQKLALARTLLPRPSLIFLDEPTAGLDVMSASAVRDDLAFLVGQEGVTVFLTTHNMTEAEKLCSQVAVIRHGNLVATGHPDELRARTDSPRVEIAGRGFNNEALALMRAHPQVDTVVANNGRLTIELREEIDAAPLVSLLVGAGAQVEEVRQGKANLEDAFMSLMEEEK